MIILVTGTRSGWNDYDLEMAIWSAYLHSSELHPSSVTVIHGYADGVDTQAANSARDLGMNVQGYPLSRFPTARHRNQFMVDLVAEYMESHPHEEVLCLSFADKWASGTGMCARMARRAGIPVIDYGVDTSLEARP